MLSRIWLVAALASSALVSATPASAHGLAGDSHAGPWTFDPLSLVLLGLVGFVYGRAAEHMRETEAGRRVAGSWRIASFFVGLAVLWVAVGSPLEAAADRTLSAHMTQHLLIIIVAPLFISNARPALVLSRYAHGHSRLRLPLRALERAFRPSAITYLAFGATLWLWHIPPVYVAATQFAALHLLEHACFFAIGCYLWWLVQRSRLAACSTAPVAFVFVFGVMLQMEVLGILMTFSSRVWYSGAYTQGVWGLTALQDQELAAVLMWVPVNIALFGAALYALLAWLAGDSPESGHRENAWASLRRLFEAS